MEHSVHVAVTLVVYCCAAFCKNPADRQWYLFDDTKVTPIQEEDVVTRAAYLLFYQRRSPQNRNPSDPAHWIHKLGQINYKATRVPPVSKSHEDLLDGGGKERLMGEGGRRKRSGPPSGMTVLRFGEFYYGGGSGRSWMLQLPRSMGGPVTYL